MFSRRHKFKFDKDFGGQSDEAGGQEHFGLLGRRLGLGGDSPGRRAAACRAGGSPVASSHGRERAEIVFSLLDEMRGHS